MKCLEHMDRLHLPADLTIQLLKLYESKGESNYYKSLFSRDDEVMARNTLELDTEYLTRYLNLNLTEARIKLVSDPKKEFTPKNKDEILVRNLKEILTRIQFYADDFELSTNEVKDLVSVIFREYSDIRLVKNPLAKSLKLAKTFEELSSEDKLIKLVDAYHTAKRTRKYESIQLITNFYVDFIKMKVYEDKNELLALLLAYTLIVKDFKVCRYDSYFQTLLNYQTQLDSALVQAGYNWHEGFSQTESISRIFVNVLMELHKKVESKAHEYVFEKKMNKTDSIEGTILQGNQTFSKQEIRDKHPYASDATINRTLNHLKERGVIRPLGNGRSAQWVRISDKPEKFNTQQLDLFSNKE